MNDFDEMAFDAFDITTDLMGYVAHWTPSFSPDNTIICKVHRKVFQAKEIDWLLVSGINYTADQTVIEYLEHKLPGLKASTESNGVENIVLDGVLHNVQSCFNIKDGHVVYAFIIPVVGSSIP